MSTSRCVRGISIALAFIVSVGRADGAPPPQPTIWAGTPDVAAFERAEVAHLAAADRAVKRLVTVKGARTVENTLAPFDEAVRRIDSAIYFADLVQKVHPDAAFRDRATEAYRKASAAQTALSLNQPVYRALTQLHPAGADPATRYYLQRQLLEFRLAGVNRTRAERTKLKALNDTLTNAQAMFDRNIADDQRGVDLADASELDGLPQDYIDRHKAGADGKIRVSTDYPDVFPALRFAKSASLRQRLYVALNNRAYPKNRDVLLEMMRTRYQIATLLGYASWADYNAADKMVSRGEDIARFIADLDRAARPIADREYAMLLEEFRKGHPDATGISDADRSYVQEMLRRSQFDFDSQTVRAYLPYQRVKQGLMATAARLFQVEFRQEQNLSVWEPAVETWDVLDHGTMIGRFYLDMHPRPGKYSHAQMSQLLDGVRGKQLPEAILICNFPAPTATDPGLMEYNDAVTFFHEFGHLMHGIIGGQQRWAGISGITMESDFAEAPSQMLERWMRSPQVLKSFARHYKSGEVIPDELIARMNRANAFGRGTFVETQLLYSQVSYDYYRTRPEQIDVDAVYRDDTRRYSPYVPVPDDHGYARFGHLAGYSSAYYTYMWDLVIAADLYNQFDPQDLFAGDAPARYKHLVLEPGGSMSANDLVRNFLGRPQNMAAIERWMGEEFAAAPHP